MSRRITQYDILISCPGDVQEELEIINQIIDDFNRTIGNANNVNLAVKHWSTHVYPESGGKPQDLINKQIVLDCDIAVAVFWTRFGTPTDNYDSGTEEEIELLLKENKQVFLYFSNSPLSPKDLISEQYERVKEFQNKYRDKGLYAEYNNVEDFRKKFTNHLTTYFLKKLSEYDSPESSDKIPNLSINGIDIDNTIGKPRNNHYNLQESQFMKSIELQINEMYESIKKIELPFEKVEESNELGTNFTSVDIGITTPSLNTKSNIVRVVHIAKKNIELIMAFAENREISVDKESFFNLGELLERKRVIGGLYGMDPSNKLSGSEEEIQKYRLINELGLSIDRYNQWQYYFKKIDSKSFLQLVVSNNGTTFDEDVDIKLFIPKDEIVQKKDLPFPENEILKDAIEILENIYLIKPRYNLEEYNSGTNHIHIPKVPLPSFMSSSDSTESLREEFRGNIEDIFNYNSYQDEEFDIISFNISYIKQHTNIGFPSLLLFHSKIYEIKFEINSKHSPEVVKGSLKIL